MSNGLGAGWSHVFSNTVRAVSHESAMLIKPSRTCHCYKHLDLTTGVYTAPPDADNSLTWSWSRNNWTERQPDGLMLIYDYTAGVGKLVQLQKGLQSWTLNYTGTRLTAITGPNSSSLAYDANNNLQSFTDAAGRVYSFTVQRV